MYRTDNHTVNSTDPWWFSGFRPSHQVYPTSIQTQGVTESPYPSTLLSNKYLVNGLLCGLNKPASVWPRLMGEYKGLGDGWMTVMSPDHPSATGIVREAYPSSGQSWWPFNRRSNPIKIQPYSRPHSQSSAGNRWGLRL